MPLQITAIGEGLGCTIEQDYPNAVAAGTGMVKQATATQWGYFGYFSDPDGHFWKVASAS